MPLLRRGMKEARSECRLIHLESLDFPHNVQRPYSLFVCLSVFYIHIQLLFGHLKVWSLVFGKLDSYNTWQSSQMLGKPKKFAQLDYLISNQLEKLEAAKAAWLVCHSLLSLTGSFLVLLGPFGSFWVNFFDLTEPYLPLLDLLSLTGPYSALLGLT